MAGDLVEAALSYAKIGWRVFPCCSIRDGKPGCGWPKCQSPGKHPLIQGGFKNASSDPEQIRGWWQRFPDANVGIATGEGSGIFVLDLDSPDAEERVKRLEAQHGALPVTVMARTGKGSHYFFGWNPERPVGSKAKVDGLPIDTRGEGGYVIAAPSKHESGHRYEWIHPPGQTAVAPSPDWLLDYLFGDRKPTATPAAVDPFAACVEDDLRTHPGVAKGGRHSTAARLVGAALGRGTDPLDVLDLAYRWADRCDPPMPCDEVLRIIKDFTAKDAAKLDAAEPAPAEPWPVMGADALTGIAGEFIRTVEPHTEADPNALLVQFLAVAGTAFGRSPHYAVEATRHATNLFAVVVGDTGDGRKGTGFDRVKAVFSDEVQKRFAKGLSSGEGLIYHVRDPLYKKEESKKKGVVVNEEEKLVDEGVSDKRLLVYESEFASVLSHMKRDTNILSNVLRQAWEAGDLGTMTKNCPTKASGAHVSIVGNVTKEELVASLTAVDSNNGFANRFLWAMSRRSKLLPFGGADADLTAVRERLTGAITFAQTVGRVEMDDDSRTLWEELYRGYAASRPGLFGKVTSRRAPQTLRLAVIYALLDNSKVIRVEHLRAGAAVWHYCEQSARYIFGDRTGNPVDDRLLQEVRKRPHKMSELHKLFSNHVPADQVRAALLRLSNQGLIRRERVQTGGRPSEVFIAV